MASVDNEWDERRLCPDGACVGVLSAEGLCSVCGERGGGPLEGGFRAHAYVPAESARAHDVLVTVTPATAVEPDDDDGFDDERELCPDGACIGVIGAGGVCKVCGTPRK